MPIVGLEPAVKPACLTTVTRKIAVLATAHSLKSDMFLDTASRWASDVEVVKVVGEGFVELVENDMEHTDEAERLVRKAVEPLLGRGVDKLVLGCTHYPFLRPIIEHIVADAGIDVIDSGAAVARRVAWLLDRYDITAEESNVPTMRYITFADEEYRKRLEHKAQIIVL
jgi:glutamate racemase